MRFAFRSQVQRSFVADTALNVAANIFLAGLGMVSGILAARLLGPNGRGQLAAIQTWPSFIAGLAAVGMPEALVYYSARQPFEAGRYLGSAMVVGLASSLPFMVAGYLLMPLLLHAQPPAIVWAGRWYLLLVPVFILMGLPRHPMQGRGDFVPWNAMRIAPNVLWIGVLAVAWVCSRAVPTFVAATNLAAFALLIFPFALLAARRIPGPYRPDPHKWPSLLAYGLPCMATMVPQTLNVRLDQMLMAALLPPRDLGLYVVAVAWSGALAPLLNALGATTMPAVASASDAGEAARRIATGTRMAAALGFALWLALSAVTPTAIVLLFGERFQAAIPAALVLVPAGAILGFNFVLEEALRGMGRPQAALKAELAGLTVTAAVLAAMLRPLGIMGAALASLLGYSAVATVGLFSVRRYAATPILALLQPRFDEMLLVLRRLVALVGAPQLSVRE